MRGPRESSMDPFVYNAQPARVVFGFGTVGSLRAEVERLGCRRALVLSTPEQKSHAEIIAASLEGLTAGVFPGAIMHTPVEVTQQAMQAVKERQADCTVAVGGGST